MSRFQKSSSFLVIAVCATCMVTAALGAASEEPASFSSITIEADEFQGLVRIREDGGSRDFRFSVRDVRTPEGELVLGSNLAVTRQGLVADGVVYPLDDLRIEEIYEGDDDLIGIVIEYRKPTPASERRRVQRNRLGVAQRVIVGSDDFVRGDVVCFGGNIEVNGEVNRNVVALFGDIIIKSDGIVRSDVAAIGGRVYLRGEALVYGDISAHHGVKKSSRSRLVVYSDGGSPHCFSATGGYNRVDGLSLFAKYTLADPDSLLPSVHIGAGYAFEAQRLRYDVGAHQRLFEKYSFTFGGSFFRETSSDDHWLSPGWEPSALAILAAEDPLDYYEEEGGRAYFTFSPGYYNELGVSYRFTTLRWMDHHPKLWSVFGWDKEFRANFSSVPANERMERRDEFDSKLGQLTAWYTLDTRDESDEHFQSGWWAGLEYQTAGDRLKGDHDFDRFTAEVRRYQPITYRQSINARIKYGTSGRNLPLFREFYLGGMRTVRGLDHKSLRGEQMLLGNFEYVLSFPQRTFETALLLDIGKVIGRNEDILSDGDFHTSVGVRFGLEEGINIELAKSLDESDKSLKLWVLFERSF